MSNPDDPKKGKTSEETEDAPSGSYQRPVLSQMLLSAPPVLDQNDDIEEMTSVQLSPIRRLQTPSIGISRPDALLSDAPKPKVLNLAPGALSAVAPMQPGFSLQAKPAHVHGPSCNHDHAEHDHAGHAHSHDHSHAHPPAYQARPTTKNPSKDGRTAIQLDLEAMLPGERDDVGRFAELRTLLLRQPGLLAVNFIVDTPPWLEVVYDAQVIDTEAAIKVAQTIGARASKQFLTKTWLVRDMDSPACAEVIEHVLRRLPGVLSAEVAYGAERLVVEYDQSLIRPADLEKRMSGVGYTLEVPVEGHAHHGHNCGLAPQYGMTLVMVAGACLAAGWGISWLHAPEWASIALYAGALLAAGWYPVRSAWASVRQGRLDIETLMILAAVGAGALGAFFEGAFLLFLFSLGHSLEHRAMDQARRAIEALSRLRPVTAWMRREGKLVEVPISQVKRGDKITLRPGDRLPLDGIVRAGHSHLDQAAITGESVPVPKAPGDQVFAGTLNSDGSLEIEVTRLGGESTLARLVEMVAQAEASKSKVQRLTSRIESVMVPVVLICTPLVILGFGLFSTLGWKGAFLRGLSLLVAASPCALAISTPAAVLSAVARAARGGVLIKGGAHLDSLGTASAIAFDKTGTLTQGKPKFVSATTLQGDENTLLQVAASAETLSAHPLAKAIVAGAKERGLSLLAASDLEAIHGKGLRAKVGGQAVAIGTIELFGTVPAPVRAAVEALNTKGQTTMIVQQAGNFLGVIGVADTLRAEAKSAVQQLRALGIQKTILLSGDHAQVAKAVATEVGIDEVQAPLLPEDKVRAMRIFARGGSIAMVGDGVNDAPALAAASVGISLGGAGSDVALETADVVLMGDDLRRLPFAVGLARASAVAVRQNVTIAIGVSLILSIASVLGWVQISQAVVLHEGSTLLVAANGLRLLLWREPKV